MVSGPHRIRAVFILLAFALGGLALPVAHQLDHLLDRQLDAPAHEEATLETTNTAQLHDCSLCEVRLAAAAFEAPDQTPAGVAPLLASPAPDRVPLASTRAFDGRAPPALS